MAKNQIIKKPYDFTNDDGKRIVGHNYFVRLEVQGFGNVDFKIIAKSDLDKQVLEQQAHTVDDK